MLTAQRSAGILMGGLLWCGLTATADAQAPSVAQMLQYRPKQANLKYDTPTAAEQAGCKVVLVRGTVKGSSGWKLQDARKRPLRRFFDSDGNGRIDVYSYYRNGLEVYREIDSTGNNRVDQYRWYNSGGMRWGTDADGDGKIETWRMISAEEVAREAVHALAAKDFTRLKTLMISQDELKSLGLPEAYARKITAKFQQAQKSFAEITAKLTIPAAALAAARVESAVPQCVPADSIGIQNDVIRFPTRTVLYPAAGGRFDMINTGEMIKVGKAWRLLDVPRPGGHNPVTPTQDPKLQVVMDLLTKHDAVAVNPEKPGPDQRVVDWNMKRAEIIRRIIALTPKSEKAIWIKQEGDNLQQAAIHSAKNDTKAMSDLRKLRDGLTSSQPGSNLAAYMTFRTLMAEYMPKLADGADAGKHQAALTKELIAFVSRYPKAEDTPDALFQLASGSDFAGKTEDAVKWYKQLTDSFPKHREATRARGAIRRLGLVGKKMELSGETLGGGKFDISSQRGNAIVVYYWASYCTACAESFAKLNKLHDTYAPKGLRFVTVNLDDTATQARNFLTKNKLPAFHLFAPGKNGGMTSPLANQYGIMLLPTMILVDKDGTVIDRNIQINDLEDAVRKALK